MTGQEISPVLEEDQEEEEEEETSLKRGKLRKSHRMSRYHSRRSRDRSLSERSSCYTRRSRELHWRAESPRQLWEPNEEEEDDSHIKRKKRRRQKSQKYQTGEYLTEREEERVGYPHRRRKSKAGTIWEGVSGTRLGTNMGIFCFVAFFLLCGGFRGEFHVLFCFVFLCNVETPSLLMALCPQHGLLQFISSSFKNIYSEFCSRKQQLM